MSFSYTDPNGTAWTIDSSGDLRAFSTYSLYDIGAVLTLAKVATDGTTSQLSLSTGTATATASTQSVTLSATGVSAVRRSEVLNDGAGRYFMRIVETVTNTGTVPAHFLLTLTDDMYADSNTSLTGTSNGDASYTDADDWYRTGSIQVDYPAPLHVVSGGRAAPDRASRSGNDIFSTGYDLQLAVGESATVIHFYVVTPTTAASAAFGDTLTTLPAYAIAGLTSAELTGLANFTRDVTAATTTVLQSFESNLTLTGTGAIDGTGNAGDNVITGNDAANTLNGGDGNDTLIGNGGADVMIGGKGDDRYYLAAGDTVTENANEGVDTVFASVSYSINTLDRAYLENVTLIGSAVTAVGNGGNNVLIGNAKDNSLTGNGGNDTLDGGAGADKMTGGDGDDQYFVDTLGDTVAESSAGGTDTVFASISGYSLGSYVENLTLVGAAVSGSGNSLANVITGNALANTLTGGKGNDTYYVESGDIIVETSTGGVDTAVAGTSYVLGSFVENLTLSDSALAYSATGNTLANVLTGNAQGNLLDGAGGADTMIGGLGNDIYVVDAAGDMVTEALNGGLDTVRSALADYTLGTNVENGVLLANGVDMTGNTLNNAITGNRDANDLYGLVGDDTLRGAGGNDRLEGGDGNDLLIGDQGSADIGVATGEADIGGSPLSLTVSAPNAATGTITLSGTISRLSLSEGPINIVYVIDHSGSMSTAFQGTVSLGDINGDGYVNSTMDAAIASFERLNDLLAGSGLGSTINLALIPFESTATTTFIGHPTDDSDGDGIVDVVEAIYALAPAGGTNYTDALTRAASFLEGQPAGRNIVFFVSDGAPDNTTYLTSVLPALLATGPEGTLIRAIGTGSGANAQVLDILDDLIDNDSAQIVLNPQDLDVTLTDLLVDVDDGAWVEIYRNGNLLQIIGRDQFTQSPLGLVFSADVALSGSGTDTFTAVLVTSDPEGDTVSTAISVDNAVFVSNDTLIGGAGNDTLDGGIGTDTMTGGTGNDIYYVDNAGDVVVEAINEGTDTLYARVGIAALANHVENLVLLGTAAGGTGNALANVITGTAANNVLAGLDGNDTLNGGGGDDMLQGGLANDLLYGNADNDTLDGGVGNDSMYGGLGDDTYYIDSTLDYAYEYSNQGVDTIFTTLNTTIGGSFTGVVTQDSFTGYFENLTLVGSATIAVGNPYDNALTGNAAANQLYGLEGNDILDGGAGADIMNGGVGNDTFYVDTAADVLIDVSGTDTVISTISLTLADGFEKLVLASTAAATNATGNAGINQLVGNEFSNRMDGKAGADTMEGKGGNDSYFVDNASDRVIETAGAGTDIVYATVSYLLSANVENLSLRGTIGVSGAGNALANVITGNSAANRLLGDAGDDTLDGGLGSDTLIGGAGKDVFVFDSALGATNIDAIQDFAAVDDTIRLDSSVFTAFTSNGAIAAGAFHAGAGLVAGNQLDDRIVYDTTTGALYYDADGTGGAAAVRFATLSPGLSLTAADFVIA